MNSELGTLLDDLADLYQRQAEAEAAWAEGRVADYTLWLAKIDERAKWIRQLERRRAELERGDE